jgi:hypothetical protein
LCNPTDDSYSSGGRFIQRPDHHQNAGEAGPLVTAKILENPAYGSAPPSIALGGPDWADKNPIA